MVNTSTLLRCISQQIDRTEEKELDQNLLEYYEDTDEARAEMTEGGLDVKASIPKDTDRGELCSEAERRKAIDYFRLEEEKAVRIGREACVVLRGIEESARQRARPRPEYTHVNRPPALQAWGSFRDMLSKYAETLSSPSEAHPYVAKDIELLLRTPTESTSERSSKAIL